jgi:histidinol-phosphate phosphatase family protein
MDALHGPDWRLCAAAPRGAFYSHVATVTTATVAILATTAWLAQIVRFAWQRIAPGPRNPREIAALALTSIAIPFAAVAHHVRARLGLRSLLADTQRAPHPIAPAVLLDRDGTLIVDVPYNADPEAVLPMPGARDALERLRAAGVATAIISNQSGIALERLAASDVAAINARVEAVLGPLGPVFVCPHHPDAGCECRKPAPGLVTAAAAALGVEPRDCVVIGDIGADVEAAHAAGARAILVPTPVTLHDEVVRAPLAVADLAAAVDAVLAGAP